MKRKILGLVLVLCILAAYVPCVYAETITEGFLTLDSETGVIIACDKSVSGEFVIPSEVGGITVLGIGMNAFQGCENLQNVVIPDSVKWIGDGAFKNCADLENVTLGSGVETLGEGVYLLSDKLKNIDVSLTNPNYKSENGVLYTKDGSMIIQYPIGRASANFSIPDGVTSIEERAFQGGINLTHIKIPDSVKSIGYYAFFNTGVYNDETNWENKVLYIGNHLIRAKQDIKECIIKNTTISIADGAFWDCYLEHVTIPNSITRIGNTVFFYCTFLKNVIIPDSVTSIGREAFSHCYNLESITIPGSVKSIGVRAFDACVSSKKAILCEGVETIEEKAFFNGSLSSVIIPKSVISIGEGVFQSNYRLNDIYYNGTYDDRIKIDIAAANNDILFQTKWHYNTSEFPTPSIDDITKVTDNNDGTYTVVANVSDIPYDCVLIVSMSDENSIVGVKSQNVTSLEQEISLSVTADNPKSVKIFIWDSPEGMKPLCKAKNIEL